MDDHSPSRRLHGFSTNRPPPLPAYPESPKGHHRRDSSGSESESSSDASEGRSPPRVHQAQPGYATRRPQFSSQSQGYHDRRRPTHLHATIYVDDPPYVPRDTPTRPSGYHYAPRGGHNQVQHAPVDYRRVPPLPPHTPSTQYSGRRGSSPSGSERSHGGQESDDSGDGSETSVSSEESNRGRPHRVQQVSMAGVFHVHEPVLTNPYLPYNPARYPAYDAHARRVGLEHVRYESTPHEPSPGHTYYRPRTHHYPPPRETPSPVNEPMVLDSPPRSPEPYTPPVERSPSPPTPRIGYDTRAPSPVNTRAPVRQPSPARPPPPPPPPHAPPEPMRQSPPPMAPFSPTNTANTAQSSKDSDPSGSPAPEDDVTLDMLADPTYPGQKPNYPYPILVKAAILSSAKRRLTLQEIYLALQCRFQWFRDNAKDKAWQNSIRHNLSLNKLFRKIPRDITEPGKGSYWTVDVGAGAGNKRERKRNKRPTKAERLAMQGLASTSNQMDDQSSDEEGDDVSLKATTTQSLSQSLGQTAAFSVNIAPLQPDTNIDPELREGGHVIGEGRSRSQTGASARNNARRGESPYTRSQGAASGGHSQPKFGQPSFGQPAFGQPSFGTFQGTLGAPPQPAPARPKQSNNPVSTAPTFRVTMPAKGRPSGRPSNAARGRATPSMSTSTAQAASIPIAPILQSAILQPTLHPSLNFAREAVDAGTAGRLAGEPAGLGPGAGAPPVPPAQAYRQGSTSSDSSQG